MMLLICCEALVCCLSQTFCVKFEVCVSIWVQYPSTGEILCKYTPVQVCG